MAWSGKSQVGIERASIVVISLFGAMLAALLSFYAVFLGTAGGAAKDVFGGRFTVSGCMSLLAIGCIFMVVQFIRGKTWAWWSAFVVSAMVFAFGMFCLWCAFFPGNNFERSETQFLLLAGAMFTTPSAITGTLLNLSQVRGRFIPQA